uniref:Polyprotein protein n=1 Tax=Solanum tuberosum TaxID=4113 RepID=M1DI53_SOLTU
MAGFVTTDHSALLIGIADQLGDSPFGVVHCRLTPTICIIVLWVIRRHGTASQSFSVMRRLRFFSTNLILSFRAQHTGTKGESGCDSESYCNLEEEVAAKSEAETDKEQLGVDKQETYEGLTEVEEAMIDSAVHISLTDTTMAGSSVTDTPGTNGQDQSVAPGNDASTDTPTG